MSATRQRSRASLLCVAVLLPLFAASVAHAGQTICVFDPAGKAGDYYGMLNDFSVDATAWGADIKLKVYLDQETATRDYDAGRCDGVVVTGARLQRFNLFPATIEAMGAVGSYELLQSMLDSLAKYPSAAKHMKKGGHETIGIIPLGAVYLFLRDRSNDTVAELAGKRIATMTYDKASPVMVKQLGAVLVPADLATFGPKFNNGDVDACYVSATGYRPFELHRGIGKKGGILQLPLAQGTLQVMIHTDRFPATMGTEGRKWFAARFPKALEVVKRAEADIPATTWIPVAEADLPGFDELFLQGRLQLRDKHKIYDAKMLSALRKVRCSKAPGRAECAAKRE